MNPFEKSTSHWVKYSEYEIKKAEDGNRYITPTPNAKPTIFEPLKSTETLVVDALNVGQLLMSRKSNEEVQTAVMAFVHKYGLLGLMTALPTTPHFIDYEAVYLPKNHFIKAETMSTQEYLALFFPFKKPSFTKVGVESLWTTSEDREMIALALTFADGPQAVNMSFQREYAENYDWLLTQFKDWAFAFVSAYFYYMDYDKIDERERSLYRQGMAAFNGVAPTYHIALLDKPTIVWDFHSLLLVIQLTFSFMLTNERQSLRICKHCHKVYMASNPKAVFCSPRCKNQFNVYKSRKKKDKEK
jgi:hypothetical protein